MSDITEAKAAERVLRENEARFRALYEQTSEPFLILDAEGIRDCNTAALKLFGFEDKNELVGTLPYGPLLSPEFQPASGASATLGSTHVAEAYATRGWQAEAREVLDTARRELPDSSEAQAAWEQVNQLAAG